MINIAQYSQKGVLLRKGRLVAKLWPNGEIAIYPRALKALNEPHSPVSSHPQSDKAGFSAASTDEPPTDRAQRVGLVNTRDFDKVEEPKRRVGLKGITSKGKRMVRNACYVMQRDVRKTRISFTTVTIPSLPIEQMEQLHKNWNRVIDAYRREVRRCLKDFGLPGEIVGVTEIQPERFENSGLPVLHGHFAFVGADIRGRWAISPSKHDEIWHRALSVVLPIEIYQVKAACKMLPVKKSVESYLGKYMSKGGEIVNKAVESGFIEWMPRQWWSLSRKLKSRIDKEVCQFSHGINWLFETMLDENTYLWRYHKDILSHREDSPDLWIATVGKLSTRANSMVRDVLDLQTSIPQ